MTPNLNIADRPLRDLENDELGHAPFARSIARALAKMDASDSFVMALTGPWGSGKSTRASRLADVEDLAKWPVFQVDVRAIRAAGQLVKQAQVSFWDALMGGAAGRRGRACF